MTQDLTTLFLNQYQRQAQTLQWYPDNRQQQLLEKIAHVYQTRLYPPKQSYITTLLNNFGQRRGTSSFIKNSFQKGWVKFFNLSLKPPSFSPKGIYLYGPVGRGKTVLMDIVANTLPTSRKIRWHFTEFMQIIHQMNASFSQNTQKNQPIDQSISALIQNYDYLFLDELEITEIADAMLVGRLFKGLTEAGIIVFITSNTAPEHLYQGGLHYDRFYPFVRYIDSIFQAFNLNNDQQTDFRTVDKLLTSKNFTLETLKQLFEDMVVIEGYHPTQLTVNQRILKFTNATKNAVWLDFNEFGQKAYGAADYQVISKNFAYVFLINVPLFNQQNQNASRRFITLIDCLYDEGVKLYLQAAAPLDSLFMVKGKNPLAVQRTVSRLIEMQRNLLS